MTLAHNQHRVARVMHAMLAHRAQQGTGEAVMAATAHHEQVRAVRNVQ